MKIPVLIALALGMLLNACASVPPGEDARGAALRFSATPVLDAIARFQHDRGRPPSSMYELVPDYLKSLPPEPAV
ncbi:MAG TPA: hypothetical protein VHE37_09770, partial [Nevskiaceae bacterium]|nr:hypothetical protein [Nevskiaceae bacterium]